MPFREFGWPSRCSLARQSAFHPDCCPCGQLCPNAFDPPGGSRVSADDCEELGGPETCCQESHPKEALFGQRLARPPRPRRPGPRRSRAREAREVQTPRFKIDDLGQEVPDVRAEAAIIYNPETNQVLWESNAQDQRSIASITKVMTALVFLESGMPLTTPVTVQRGDVYRASTTYLRAGYQVTADDLLNLLLIGSDNAAARALARISPYGAAGFIDRMNEKAAELGLEQTQYADPSGLLATNVSSAYDMARLIAFAAADERIGSDHAQGHAHRLRRQAHDQRHQHESARAQRRIRRPRRQDRLHQPLRLLPRDAAPSAARPASRSPSSCSARSRTRAASGRRATCSTG